MKKGKRSFLLMLFSFCAQAGDPDESGLGGTGINGNDIIMEQSFELPDLPERMELPQIEVPEPVAPPDIGEVTEPTVVDVPDTDTVDVPDTGTADTATQGP